jgi:hypothetical protein
MVFQCLLPAKLSGVALVCMFAALNSQVNFLNVDNKMSDLDD